MYQLSEKIIQGHFLVETHTGKFNVVAANMKLEGKTQRSQNSSSIIIGQTIQTDFVSEWEVDYHEVLDISNTFRNLTRSRIGEKECKFHHKLNGNY